jgi:flagellar basal-body rod modification protein FlgD
LVSESTFLQLLVAQLQNQDPLNPDAQSGTQMVSELAQFSELEQVMGIGQNVQTITTDISSQAPASTPSSSNTPSTPTGAA